MKKKLKILFVTHPWHARPYTFRESNAISLSGLGKELQKLGHEVHILQTRKLFPKVSIGEYDIVHGFSNAPIKAIKTWWVGRQTKAKTVHSIKGISSRWLGGLKFSKLLRLIDKVVFPPIDFLELKIDKKLDYEIIPTNIDTNKFKPKNIKKYKRPTILYFGPLHPQRGVDMLVEAISQLPQYNLMIIPRYNNLDELKKTTIKLINECKNIELLDFTEGDKLPYYINKSWLACFPYQNSTDVAIPPAALLECWASKLPVFTTYDTDFNNAIYDKTWLIFPSRLHLQNVLYNLNDINAMKGMMKNITKKAYKESKKYDNKIIAKKYEELYRKLR